MILPTKHIETKRSILAIGAKILEYLDKPISVSSLWEQMRCLPATGSFERYCLSLDFLYALGTIEFHDGILRRAQQ